MGIFITANAQEKTPLKKKTNESKPQSAPSVIVDGLVKPVNIKGSPVEEDKSRGDVCCPNYYGDLIIDNWTGYYIDIYVESKYRGTVAPYDKKVTWAILGTTRLYAKAVFEDTGSYLYWGPKTVYVGYEYKWKLMP